MSKKVLIRKQAGGVQQFQQIGGRGGPSFMDLARRVRDPTASGWQKVIAGLGMAGKTAAGIGAANQTLQQMHGGNAFAPLNLGYTYQGLDLPRECKQLSLRVNNKMRIFVKDYKGVQIMMFVPPPAWELT